MTHSRPTLRAAVAFLAFVPPALWAQGGASAITTAASFTLDQVMSAPYPANLTAAITGEKLAWTFNERGQRNVWVAEGPAFEARRLTSYEADDGQELNAVQISRDGKWVVYMRGGDFGSNWDDALPANPTAMPNPVKVEIWAVPFGGGAPVSLGEGVNPVISPLSDVVVVERTRQLWSGPIDGSAPAKRLFDQRGNASDARFSPDGSHLAFVSERGDHAFIGIYTNETTPIRYLAPATNRDQSPRWSTDGRQIVFVRRPGAGGAPVNSLEFQPQPWSLWIVDTTTGAAKLRWASEASFRGAIPSTHGGVNLHWAKGDRIVFMSNQDGWPHLYSLIAGGSDAPILLTPGDHMAEHVALSSDGAAILYTGNLGSTPGDIDRRHLVRTPVDRAAPDVLTPGTGLEWAPVSMGTGRIAAIGGTAQKPPSPFVLEGATSRRWLGEAQLPKDFPTANLIVPRQIVFKAPDGLGIHAQLFEPPKGGAARKAAVVYVHGGPPRQMLLGWHYGDYYWNAYAMNQYLASRGFVVLSVNYRLGIGYGHEFLRPARAGIAGASEYMDVKAAGEWLRGQTDVDPARIAIYGGSYGGYLTALALGRDSGLFSTGVDIHGVHDMTSDAGLRFGANTWRFERPTSVVESLARVAWEASPVSAVGSWRSPALFIHADDDRNVRFAQTVDLLQRLRAQKVEVEEMTIVDDTHHFLRHENQKRVNAAIAEYLERKLKPAR